MSTHQAHVHVSSFHAPRPAFVSVKGSPRPLRLVVTRASLLLALTTFTAACGESNPGDESRAGTELRDEALPLGQGHALDILVVVDNSGSMAEEQANLAAHFDGLLNSLQAKYGALDLRIGVTTTDNGNVLCSGTSPEAGSLQLSSCRTRSQQFTNVQGTENQFDVGCAAQCPEGVNFLPDEFERPWIEHSPEGSNLPDGLDLATALACALPQGIHGCGFESTLEGVAKGIQRAMSPGEHQYGFLRDDASLLVVVLTDEEDCSMNAEWDEEVAVLQIPEGQRLFWSDPQTHPTSAICWNAGVRCEAVPDGQLCFAADRGVGNPGQIALGNNPLSSEDDAPNPGPWPTTILDDPENPEQNAVMFPLSKYEALLDEVRAAKQAVRPDADVSLAVFAGVPIGYHADPSLEIVYQTPDDPEVALEFGIDYGCETETSAAVPPVRLRELAEAYPMGEGRNLYSICEPSYEPALQDIATQLAAPSAAVCLSRCAADADPTTTWLDVQCELFAERSDGTRRTLPPCEGGVVPAGATTCVQIHAGDSLGDRCRGDGKNVGFTFQHAPGSGFASDEQVIASCLTSDEDTARSCL